MSLKNDPALNAWKLSLQEDEWQGMDVAVETVRHHFPRIDVYCAELAGYRKTVSFGRYEPSKRKGKPLLAVQLFAEPGRSYIAVRSGWMELQGAIDKVPGKSWENLRTRRITLRELAAGSEDLQELCRTLKQIDPVLLAKVTDGEALVRTDVSIREGRYIGLTEQEREEELLGDLKQLVTEQSTLILARIGQGEFRRKVLAVWGGKCAVTGVGQLETLRASHIKPWSICGGEDGSERLDANNGLALSATYDALFDRGLITFENDGRMLVSPELKDGELRSRLGLAGPGRRREIHPTLRLIKTLNATQKSYMAYHREHMFRR